MKTLLLALIALSLAGAAQASPCGDKIARLQARFAAAERDDNTRSATLAPAPETTAAKLHHQPTPVAGAAAADSPASVRSAKFKVAIEEAHAADDARDAASCEAAASRAEAALLH